MGVQNFEPAFFFEHANNVQRVILVRQLLELVTDGLVSDVLDVVVLFRGIVPGLSAFLERPMKPSGKSRSANQPGWIFDESIIVQNAQQLGFNIGGAVERIHQQAT